MQLNWIPFQRKEAMAFQYMIGATIYLFTENERLDSLSDGKYSSHELDTLCDDLVKFVTGGMMALISS